MKILKIIFGIILLLFAISYMVIAVQLMWFLGIPWIVVAGSVLVLAIIITFVMKKGNFGAKLKMVIGIILLVFTAIHVGFLVDLLWYHRASPVVEAMITFLLPGYIITLISGALWVNLSKSSKKKTKDKTKNNESQPT